jgi:hypothetical protein
MLLLLVLSLIAFLVLAAVFGIATTGLPARARWLGLGAILAGVPFLFWAGALYESFDSGICYSQVIDDIAKSAEATTSDRSRAETARTSDEGI